MNLNPQQFAKKGLKTMAVLFLTCLLLLLVSMNQWIYASNESSTKTVLEKISTQDLQDTDSSSPVGPDEKVPDNNNSSISEEYLHEAHHATFTSHFINRVIHTDGPDKLPTSFLTLFSPPPEHLF